MKLVRVSAEAKGAAAKGTIAGAVVLTIYIFIVVLTTPSLPAATAISTALNINSPIVFGTAIATGFQFFSSSFIKRLGCRVRESRIVIGSSGTALSSFLSFFTLVPLGCCSSWLLVLSLLPAVVGSSASIFLISYSRPLSYFGLIVIIGFAISSGLKLHRQLKQGRNGLPLHKEL